jgi:hypothetical protein
MKISSLNSIRVSDSSCRINKPVLEKPLEIHRRSNQNAVQYVILSYCWSLLLLFLFLNFLLYMFLHFLVPTSLLYTFWHYTSWSCTFFYPSFHCPAHQVYTRSSHSLPVPTLPGLTSWSYTSWPYLLSGPAIRNPYFLVLRWPFWCTSIGN